MSRPRHNTGPTTAGRALVHARSGGNCERCGASVVGAGGEVHHRNPRRMGGTSRGEVNDASNLVHLCKACHRWTEIHPDEAVRSGWLIPSWGPSATHVPIVVAALDMQAWLTDDGNYLLDPPELDQPEGTTP